MLNAFDRNLERLDGFETNYIKILYYDLPKKFSSTYKTYHYARFCTILNGEKHVTLDGDKKFCYGKNEYLLLPPHVKVHMDMEVHTTALVLELNDQLIDSVFDKVAIEVPKEKINLSMNCFLGERKDGIAEDMDRIFQTFVSRENNKEFLVDLFAQKLVFDLIKDQETHHILRGNSSHPIRVAVQYIHDHIHTGIQIKELAKELYMSESNFCHQFKKTVGVTPMEYIKNKKLELAAEYLKEESVTDVAYNLGYMNISYFIKAFKEKYDTTPKQYQIMNYGR